MNRVRITRRHFLKGAAWGASGLLLAACAPPATSTPAAMEETEVMAEPVDIDVWTGWTEGAADKIEQILNGYNDSQDMVRAHHVVVPGGSSSMMQKLLAGIAANEGPSTAVVFGADKAYQLAANNALLALDDLGHPDQVQILRDWMHPAIWDLGEYEGSFYYASMWNQSIGTFVNLDLAEAAGVDVDSPPQTLEEQIDVWEQLTTYDDRGNIDVLGGDFNWNSMILGRFHGQFIQDGTTITANHQPVLDVDDSGAGIATVGVGTGLTVGAFVGLGEGLTMVGALVGVVEGLTAGVLVGVGKGVGAAYCGSSRVDTANV